MTIEAELADGTILEFPDGTDDAVINATVKKMASAGSGRNSLSDTLSSIERKRASMPQEPSDYQGLNYVGQQLKKGVAAGMGMPVDFATNLLNLGFAGYGVAKGELTGSGDLPEPITNPFGGSGTFERLFQTNNAVQPTGPVNQFVGRTVRDLGAASVPIAGMAGKPAAFLPRNPNPVQTLQANSQGVAAPLVAGTGLSVLSSAGGEIGREVAPDGFEDVGDFAGMMAGGVVLPSMVMSRADAVKKLRDAGRPENANRIAGEYVEQKIQSDVRNFPGAKERLQRSLEMEDEIPGFQPRIGQASNVPSLLDMERRVATSGPEQFNKRAIQDEAQKAAIARQAENDLPLLAGKSDLPQQIEATRSKRLEMADSLPTVAADETGQTLRSARDMLKGRYDQIAAEKFGAPVQEAERLGVRLSSAGIMEKARELTNNPLLRFDHTNLPEVVRRTLQVGGADARQKGSQIVDSRGQPLTASAATSISFSDLKALREAVNQDLAREATSMNPNARQRMRALVDMKNEIDRAAQTAPDSVRKSYNDAVTWYRDVYAPKFLRGVNLRQSSKDITGDMKIPDEKLPGQYFKKMASTPMSRFLQLYGENKQAVRAMEDHILDTYRREVVKDAALDPKKHDAFLRNYEPALKQMPEMKDNLRNMGQAARILSEREGQLAQTQSLLERAQLDRLRYDDHGTLGLDPRKLDSFVVKNGAAFKQAIGEVYGEKVATDHITNLKKIAEAASIADRGRLSDNAFPAQSTNPLDLQKSLGFTSRTVFSMVRAVTTGRTSTEDMAFTLGMQSATHRIRMALIAAEERAISDPQTARLISDAMKQPATTESGKATLRKILEKGGLYVANTASGAKQYERMTRHRAAPVAIEATGMGNQAPGEQE